jgi:hypothetical protein
MSGFDRERLQTVTPGLNLIIALIIEQPIPDEPPVTTTTVKRFKVSISGTGIGIFMSGYDEAAGLFGSVK